VEKKSFCQQWSIAFSLAYLQISLTSLVISRIIVVNANWSMQNKTKNVKIVPSIWSKKLVKKLTYVCVFLCILVCVSMDIITSEIKRWMDGWTTLAIFTGETAESCVDLTTKARLTLSLKVSEIGPFTSDTYGLKKHGQNQIILTTFLSILLMSTGTICFDSNSRNTRFSLYS